MSRKVRTESAAEAVSNSSSSSNPETSSCPPDPVWFETGIYESMASFTEEISVLTKTIVKKSLGKGMWQSRSKS